jgi:Hemerythrin HHE cation binding domain
MDRHDIAEQIRVEQELLRHVMEGLRLSTTWQVQGPDASRKLSTLRFVTGSFQRHLERLLALEEDDGFLDQVLACAPRLARATAALRAEHDGFRSEARRVVQRLERLPATDPATLEKVGGELVALLDRIEGHNRKEMGLLLEAFERDEGGEG